MERCGSLWTCCSLLAWIQTPSECCQVIYNRNKVESVRCRYNVLLQAEVSWNINGYSPSGPALFVSYFSSISFLFFQSSTKQITPVSKYKRNESLAYVEGLIHTNPIITSVILILSVFIIKVYDHHQVYFIKTLPAPCLHPAINESFISSSTISNEFRDPFV